MDYEIVHAIEGRIRIRIPQLAFDPDYATKLQRLIEAPKLVTNVRVNPLAKSIVIQYKPKAISLAAMQAKIEQAIAQLAPPPEPEPAPAAPKPPSESIASTSPTDSPAESSAPSIDPPVDPWEDAPPAEKLAEPSAPEVAEVQQTQPPDQPSDQPPDQPLITTELAKRLGISSQALTAARSKPDFEQWSRSKDPQGVGWTYVDETKSFVPLSAKEPASPSQKSATQLEAEEMAGEVSGGLAGGAVGGVVGEVLGGLVAGPAGLVVGEEIGTLIGGAIGSSIGHTAVDDIERVRPDSPDAHKRSTREELAKEVGEGVGEVLLGEPGAIVGEEIGELVGRAVDKQIEPEAESPKEQAIEPTTPESQTPIDPATDEQAIEPVAEPSEAQVPIEPEPSEAIDPPAEPAQSPAIDPPAQTNRANKSSAKAKQSHKRKSARR